jgi:hypothetical protein
MQMHNTMNLLWAFNFVKDNSGTGNWDMDSYGVKSPSFLVIDNRSFYSFSGQRGPELAPLPFTCTITPRDERRANLINQVFEYNAKSL